MQQIIDTPNQDQVTLHYASFGARLGAALIDGIILAVIQAIVIGVIGHGDFQNPGLLPRLVSFLIQLAYFTLMETSEKQGTVGKVLVGIKVGDEYGNRISYGQAIGRYFGKLLSTVILLIGYLMVIWDVKKQALHDKLANTYVYNA